MKLKWWLLFTAFQLSQHSVNATELPRSTSAKSASVYFISPKDGEVVPQKFVVRFGLKGMGVSAAGVDVVNTGHHHLLIDATSLPDMNKPLGSEVRHFGGGQTEVEIELSEGKHRLQLLLGDKIHLPHYPALLSEEISITVKR